MSTDRFANLAIVVLLAAVGAAAWWLELRPTLTSDPSSLDRISRELGGFQAEDLPVGDTVERMLQADHHVQRAYQHPHGGLVWLYLGYYGTERGGTPEHTPRACYSAHGWELLADRSLQPASLGAGAAREYRVRHGDEDRLVLFWYRSYRSTGMDSTLALATDHVLGQLVDGRADGALVRLSTPIGDGEDEAEARVRLLRFASLLEPELEANWPHEEPVG